jgi:hypothetical protein
MNARTSCLQVFTLADLQSTGARFDIVPRFGTRRDCLNGAGAGRPDRMRSTSWSLAIESESHLISCGSLALSSFESSLSICARVRAILSATYSTGCSGSGIGSCARAIRSARFLRRASAAFTAICRASSGENLPPVVLSAAGTMAKGGASGISAS